MYEYLTTQNLLSNLQSGLRPLHSTLTALLDATDQWYTNMDNGLINGPLLFLIYINDITNDIQSGAFLFAEDAMILDVVDSPKTFAVKLNTDLASIPTVVGPINGW
jgi:hypothetical protein